MSVNILLADDHLMVREGLKQVLELDHDIDVISEASDGYECLNLINKTHPDVVLLDINMPNLDGLQVLSIMKQQKMKVLLKIKLQRTPRKQRKHQTCIHHPHLQNRMERVWLSQ